MIIIEGPDNSGKSTLGAYLQKNLQVPLVHSIKPDPAWNFSQALEQSIMQLLPQRLIRDRTYAISEYVYGPICRGGSALGPMHQKALENLMHYGHLIIYCRPPDNVILNNGDREQMEGVVENHLAIIHRYDRLINELESCGVLKVIKYDYTKSSAVEMGRILHEAQMHQHYADLAFKSAQILQGN